MTYTLYPDVATRHRAMRHARGDYQRRLLRGDEPWDGPGGQWDDSRLASIRNLRARLRAAGYRVAPALTRSMAISRDGQDLANFLTDLRDGTVGVAA